MKKKGHDKSPIALRLSISTKTRVAKHVKNQDLASMVKLGSQNEAPMIKYNPP
jgi:hypothetical protein